MGYDPWDPAVIDNPYEHYRWLRDEQPVYRHPNGFAVLSRYEDVTEALRDHRAFSSADGPSVWKQDDFGFIGEDPPAHTLRRQPGIRPLMKSTLARLESTLSERAGALVRRAAQRAGVDVVAEVIDPMVTQSLADALGIMGIDADAMVAVSERTFKSISSPVPIPVVDLDDPRTLALGTFVDNAIEDRMQRGEPGPGDMVDAVVARAEATGDHPGFKRFDRMMYISAFVGPGVETTRDLMGNALDLAAHFPGEWDRVLAGDATPAMFVEEALRYDAPVQGFFRTMTQDVETSDGVVRAGDRVLVLYGSANRDERAFPRADRFVADRHPNDHVSFGLGIHFCMGATLARMEATALFTAIAQSGLRPARVGEGERTTDALIRGYRKLPIAFL